MPRNIFVRVLYILLVVIAVLLLIACIGASVWAGTAEDGWITVNAFMLIGWVVSSPFILGAIAWTIILFVGGRNSSTSDKMNV